MNVFFEKIFKSFPDRQNFKIFPQRAYKHLQNTKKYVIINKLISITIKNGLMVKRLRRCPLTAESAVRFRMGLPKKETTPLVVLFLFFSTPLSGTTRQLVAVVRQFAQANFCRGTPFYEGQKFPKGHANGNGNFRMGLRTSSVRGNDAATCLPSFVFASANFAVGSHRPHLYFPISYIWETATSAWGYILLRCAEKLGNFIFI